MRIPTLLSAIALLSMTITLVLIGHPAEAETVTTSTTDSDITSLITADGGNDSIVLAGATYTITLPAATTVTYNGIISGTGVMEVTGAGKLILTSSTGYSLPAAGQAETVVSDGYFSSASSAYTYDGIVVADFQGTISVIQGQDPPAFIVDVGATVQLGNSSTLEVNIASLGSTGADYGASVNLLNIEVNGTLIDGNGVDTNHDIALGITTGTGTIVAEGSAIQFFGASPFSGPLIIYNNMAANLGGTELAGTIADASYILNAGSFFPKTPIAGAGNPGVYELTQDIFSAHYGNDININRAQGLIVLDGVYSYTENGYLGTPSLSDPNTNFTDIVGNASERGFNIEGGMVQWGNGTTRQIFLPANLVTGYLNLHSKGILGLDYDGTVALDVPIGGGSYEDSLTQAGVGTVVIRGNDSKANHVVLTQPEDYNGTTQIDSGTVLQLGDGTAGDAAGTPGTVGFFESSGGNGSLLTAESNYMLSQATAKGPALFTYAGVATDGIVDDGTILVDNVVGAYDNIGPVENELSNISGTGAVVQQGTLPLTLLGTNTYSGGTAVSGGILAVGSQTALGTGNVVNHGVLMTSGGNRMIAVFADFTQGS
jgi:autotransporter-associated beta strand protein